MENSVGSSLMRQTALLGMASCILVERLSPNMTTVLHPPITSPPPVSPQLSSYSAHLSRSSFHPSSSSAPVTSHPRNLPNTPPITSPHLTSPTPSSPSASSSHPIHQPFSTISSPFLCASFSPQQPVTTFQHLLSSATSSTSYAIHLPVSSSHPLHPPFTSPYNPYLDIFLSDWK
ncbi:hypothetical protein Pmani_020400 [Petrolisthes manimaculis]|uniref:Uncharacterized protein n=1 Tax=Petrolisthes manimaculis TaxID=1843537 RepID=A0AAE1PGB1_9EUCA|nr:hypothetical protein Pmani_020400 [Petrolisthes manimaculis]